MSFLVINKSPSGAAVYYSGAYDDATGATGNGGKYETEAQAQNWDDVKFLNAASTSTLPTGGYSSTILFSSGYVIGGTTPIGDVRGEETGYAFQGSPTVYGLDAEVLYSGALYAVYSAGGTDKLTGKVGIGTTAGDFTNNGYYAGSFTTRDNHNFETVLDVDTGNLNLTGLGSGVYTIGEQVTLQTSLVDRIGESLTTVSSITNDSFVKSLKISILDEDRNLIYDGYKTNYTNPSFTFTKQENIDIFGSFTKNFGVRFTVENQDGETHDTDFLLYGNRLSIDKIYVSASGGTYLDENPDNDYGPPTGSISLGSERTEALEGFSHRLINTSGTTGAINFNITFDQTPNFTDYDNLLIFAKTGTSVFDTTTENLLGTFPLSQLKNQNIRVFPDDGIEEGEANFFKFVGSSKVGFYDELFTVGPYTIQPIQVGEDPILYNVGDQEIVSGNLSILGDGAGGLYALGASGTGEGNRLTGPGNLPYLLTGDAGTEADTLQTVTDRGSSTTNAISALAITGTAGLNQFKGSTADTSASTIIARNSSNTSLFSIRNDGRVDIPVGPVNIGNNLYLDNNEIWAQNSNNLNVKADGLIRIQPQSYGTSATFATDGNVGIGTVAPSTKLQTIGTISGSTGRFENAKISNFNSSDYAAFGHENVADDSYAIRQHSNGNVHINCGFSRLVQFRHQNSTQGGFNASKDFFVGPSETNNTFYVDISETNVGVGTYAPIGKLTVATTMSSSPTTQLYLDVDGSNTVGGGGEVIFNTSASAGALDAFNAIVRGQRSSLNDGSSDLTFLTTHVPTSATAAARMTIKDDGKVGIGTNSPLSTLDVRGDVSGSGDFLGTGVGNRITLNGTGYLLSGEADLSTDDLQAVTDRGKSTSNKIGIGTDSTYAPYNYLEVYGAAQIQDRTTSSDGTIQLGDQTNQTITYSSSEEALKLGAGISNLDFGFGGTVGIGSSNSIVIAAPGGVTISGGSPSTGSFVGGGTGHTISGHYDSIVAGSLNKISGGNLNFIGGGSGNDVNYSRFSSSLGGKNNDISGADFSVLLGGNTNLISGGNAHVIGGGDNNQISGDDTKVASTIVGGTQNKILSNTYSFIGAGATNTIYANNSVIGGGTDNIASGDSSVVFGGSNNQVLADYGVAAGRYSKVQAGHSGAFVLSDANTTETLSSGANTLTLNFKSGVYVDTDSGIYINGNPVLTGASGFEGDTLQTVTDRGATTTNAISLYNLSDINPRLSVGRASNQSIDINVVDLDNTITANQDGDADGDHKFILDRVFAGTGKNDFQIAKSGVTQLTVDTDGNVGIGSNNPSAKLDVAGGIKLLDNNYLAWNTSNTRIVGNSDYLQFQVAASDKVRIKSDGKVGIGTITPASKLHIENTAYDFDSSPEVGDFHLMLRDLDSSVAGDAISIGFAQSTDATTVGAKLSFLTEDSYSRGGLVFSTNSTADTGDNTAERMRIASDGNVGIGTNNPSRPLHVKSSTNHAKIRLTNDSNANWDFMVGNSGYFSGYFMIHDSSAGERLAINDLGYVGIGSNAPQGLLDVKADTDQDIFLGRARFGSHVTDYLYLSHYDNATSTSYALKQSPAGSTAINAKASMNVSMNVNNSPIVFVKGSNSRVGVGGITAPSGNLHIQHNSVAGYVSDTYADLITESNDSRIQVVSDNGGNNGSALILTNVDTGTHSNWVFGQTTTAQGNKLHIGHNAAAGGDVSHYNNSKDVTITTAGDVGIGTFSPTFRLDVEDSDNILASFVSTTNKASIIIQDDTTLGYFSAENDIISIGASAGATATNLCINQNNNRVGIGTNVPQTILHTRTSDNQTARFESTTTSSKIYIIDATLEGKITVNDSIDTLSLGFEASDGDQPLHISTGGNVGIGTTDPSTLLSVGGGNSTPSLGGGTKLIVDMTQGAGNYASMSILAGNAGRSSLFFGDSDAEQRGAFDYRHADDSLSISTAASEKIRITSAGNVGIGTTTPSGKLHVFNTGNASGDIFIVDGSHGRLFNVSDETTGIIFSVNDAAGLPVLEVDSTSGYDKISIGEFGTNALVVSGSTSTFGGSVLGTGAGNRITNNGTPYLLSGDAAATLTLQDVTDNGNTTTNSITTNGLASNGNITTNSNGIGIFTRTLAARDSNGLAIRESTSTSGISINSLGNTTVDGNITMNDGKYIGQSDSLSTIVFGNLTPGNETADLSFLTSADGEFIFKRGTVIKLNMAGDVSVPSSNFKVNTDTLFVDISEDAVGINTTVPSGALDVNGVAYFRGGTTQGHTQDETDAAIVLYDNDYIYSRNAGDYLRRVIGKDSAGAIHIGEPSTSIINEVKFYAGEGALTKYTFHSGTTELVRIDGSGNLLINTTSNNFGNKLNVAGGSTRVKELQVAAGVGYSNYGKLTHNDNQFIIEAQRGSLDGDIVIKPYRNLLISGDNVGIGTHAPDRPLHVNAGTTNVVANFESTDTGAYLSFSDDSTTNDTYVRLGAVGDEFQFFAGGSERVRIDSAGFVGIGTNNPQRELEIHGAGNVFARITASTDNDSAGLELNNNGNAIWTLKADDTASDSFKITHDSVGTALTIDTSKNTTFNGDVLGTGAGNRITNNGTPYLLSGDAAATLTLQDVTDNGNTTTNDIGAGTITGNTLVITGANSTFKAFEQANDDFRIGTDTADDISIITNGSRRLTVTDAGDVGIGTTSPDTKLHVKGTAIRFEEAGGSTRHFDIIPATAGVNHKFTSDSTIAGYEFYNNANNLVNFTNTEASFNPSGENIDFRVKSSGSTAIFVDASENRVGIGTNVPSQILDVYGSESRIALTSSAGRNTVLQQGGGHFHIKTSHANGVAINYNESSDGRLAIYSGTAENIRFASNGSSWITGGSVGIGTDSPQFKLDVVDFQGGALARFKDSDSSYDGIRIEGDANGGSITNAGSFSSEAIYMQNSINAMRFYTNGQERVRIASYGTVGINQPSPSSTYSLDVGGSIRMATTAPSLVLRETDSSNQEFSVFGLGGDFYVRDITQSTYPFKIEAGVATDTLVLESGGNVGIGTNNPSLVTHIYFTGNNGLRVQSTASHSNIDVKSHNDYGAYLRFMDGSNRYWLVARSDDKLQFRPNATSLESASIYFDETGKVGIGVSNPTEKLEVNPDTDVSAVIGKAHVGYIGTSNHAGFSHVDFATSSNYALRQNNLGNTFLNCKTAGTISFNINNSTIAAFDNGGDFQVDTDTLFVDASENRVGIGSNTPAYKLDVAGDIQAKDSFVTVGLGASDGYQFHDLGTGWGFKGLTSNTRLGVLVQGIESVTFESNGRVGIGSTDPALYKLEVAGDIATDRYIRHNGDTNTYFGFSSDDTIQFNTNSSERMRITSAGNVGIGTSIPSNALDVVGHFSATSKSFLIDHPTKENKKLQYASLEGPENGVYVRGTTNSAVIELPDYWSALVHEDSITVVLTPIGKKQDLYIKSKSPETVMIGGVEGSYDYVVYGERKDIDRLEIEPDGN